MEAYKRSIRVLKVPIILILVVIIGSACNKTLTPKELISYVNNPDNGLVHEKEINGIKLKLAYKPHQLLAFQEIMAIDSLTKVKEREITKRYNQQHYFVLSISQGGKEILSSAADRQRFSQLVSQFAFGMGQKITLTTAENDTLTLLDFHYPRMYGMAPSTDILFVFEKEKQKTKSLIFYIDEFGLRTGNTRFKIHTQDIHKINNTNIKN